MERYRAIPTLLAIAALVGSSVSADAATYNMRVVRDVPYEVDLAPDDPRTMDLYLPEGQSDVPIVFFVSGGGWSTSGKDSGDVPRLVDVFVPRGMAVAAVDYRLSPAVSHPAHVEDLAVALSWLRRQAPTYGIDPSRVWLAGHSAGAHLVSLLALHPEYLARQQIPRSAIQGVMAISGVYDVMEFPEPGVTPSRAKQAFGDARDGLADASPTLHVGIDHREPVPPFLVAFTVQEPFGFDEQAKGFYTLLLKHDVPAQLVEVPDRTHDTVIAGIGQQSEESPDVLGPALLHFTDVVLDGTFSRVRHVTSSRGGSVRMPSPTIKAVRDIRYDERPGTDPIANALDVFLPADQPGPVPAVFYVHGGGWRAGDKGTPQTLIDIFGRLGMAVVSTNYRLSPAFTHPTHIQDVAHAFAWLWSHAAEYGIDRDRVFVAGTSAGGHLVTLLTLDQKYLRAEQIPAGAIKGVMSVSGIYNFPEKAEPTKVPTRRAQAFGIAESGLAEASPISYVRSDGPPFLLTYTDHDIFLEREQAHELYGALVAAGTPARLVVIPDRTHFDQVGGIGVQVALVDDVLGPALVQFVLDQGIGSAAAANDSDTVQ